MYIVLTYFLQAPSATLRNIRTTWYPWSETFLTLWKLAGDFEKGNTINNFYAQI